MSGRDVQQNVYCNCQSSAVSASKAQHALVALAALVSIASGKESTLGASPWLWQHLQQLGSSAHHPGIRQRSGLAFDRATAPMTAPPSPAVGSPETPPSVLMLPAEVESMIFARLSASELAACMATCRAWRQAASSPPLWNALIATRWRHDMIITVPEVAHAAVLTYVARRQVTVPANWALHHTESTRAEAAELCRHGSQRRHFVCCCL